MPDAGDRPGPQGAVVHEPPIVGVDERVFPHLGALVDVRNAGGEQLHSLGQQGIVATRRRDALHESPDQPGTRVDQVVNPPMHG